MSEHELVETEQHDDDTDGLEDFDAFWTRRARRGKRTRVMGELVELPPALPLEYEMEIQRLRRSKSDKDVRKLVALLFGKGAVERWAKAGMDGEQFQVLLAWAPQVIAGKDVTLAEVADELEQVRIKALSKANGKGKGQQSEPDPT